jgi:hypothetical protein
MTIGSLTPIDPVLFPDRELILFEDSQLNSLGTCWPGVLSWLNGRLQHSRLARHDGKPLLEGDKEIKMMSISDQRQLA